jgi:hypothetical protein
MRCDDVHFQTLKTCLKGLLREFGEVEFIRILKQAAEEESIRSIFEMCEELGAIYAEQLPTRQPGQ